MPDFQLSFRYLILIHFSIGITCYTCPKGAENNEICNQKAVDLPCPPNLPFCLNQNYINNISQKTILVAKTCSVQDHCVQGCQYVNHTTKVGSKTNIF